uniref:Secreted protein n=1 Tax=Angiostrongylus cantonensis TaxID=6313 RepID=A0A0K0DKZ8_ANGCA
MHWVITTILLCVYGITKGVRSPTPFLTPYLISPYKNFTLDKVHVVPVFSLTDILRYKPVVVLVGACLSLTWILLV